MGHAWNELRPAEADAWEHVYGSDCIIDLDTIAGPDAEWNPESDLPGRSLPASELVTVLARGGSSPTAVDNLIRHARAVASSPSPYSPHAREEIWHLAAHDPSAIRSAITEVDVLLARHSQRNASTADAEWLELITTKRLLSHTLESETAEY